MNIRFRRLLLLGAALLAAHGVAAEPAPAPFDLIGPTLVGTVTRGDTTLPIAKVPSFAAGDRLELNAELPTNQSAKYLLVVAFLRGPTNPPPDDWFFSCKTWTKSCLKKGLTLTVPEDAQQLLVFFAPQTGGDFKTLRSAVQGRPGAFVRSAQQLNQAALDRSRLDRYIAGVREMEDTDPGALKEVAPVLARSLAIKVDEKCLDRIPALQAPCLTQGHESLILNDGHETSMVTTLTSGPASDLAMQAGSTAKLDSGAYLPYIGSVFDIARLMDSFHTAHYQYIPALTSRRDEKMILLLNTPPSFHQPQSVLVAALPPVEPAQRLALHAVETKKSYCAYHSPFALAVEGAPLVFATGYARELALNVTSTDGKTIALPAHADAKQGGFIIDASELKGVDIDEDRRASISGYWGFDKFEGPSFALVKPKLPWLLTPGDDAALVVGREDLVHLQSGTANCVKDIRMVNSTGESSVPWKMTTSDTVELKLPLQAMEPGELMLAVHQYGVNEPQLLRLHTFADTGHLDSFTLYAGDTSGILKGGRLDQVENLSFKDYELTPGTLSSVGGSDELSLTATDAQGFSNLKAGDTAKAKVRFKDGRVLSLDVTVGSPRPKGSLLAKSIKPAPNSGRNAISLSTRDELPMDATLAFSVRAQPPTTFSRDAQIEVATADRSSSAVLSASNGAMTLESSSVAVLNLRPAMAFGSSAFGELQFRLVIHGVAGDWQPLATLVRLPALKSLECPVETDSACLLRGGNLFLLDSISGNAQFTSSVQVPEGFPGFSLVVPRPADQRLYIRLRDNPTVINEVTLAITPAAPAAATVPDKPKISSVEKASERGAPKANDASSEISAMK